MNKYLHGHNSKETAYEVDDYPWGFRLRTKIRYWIETKEGYGQRFGSQTVNPKTGLWCAPKYGVYHKLIVMFLDENDHVKHDAINHYTSFERMEEFKEKHAEAFKVAA